MHLETLEKGLLTVMECLVIFRYMDDVARLALMRNMIVHSDMGCGSGLRRNKVVQLCIRGWVKEHDCSLVH